MSKFANQTPINDRFVTESQAKHPSREVTEMSIVIPCFNEGESVAQLASTLKEFVADHEQFAVEIVIVDDGSTDDTWEVLGDYFSGWDDCELIRHEQNLGLMAAIMTGTRAASNELICSMDSDCTYHPNGIPDMFAALEPDVAVVMSSPYHPLGKVENVPQWRIQISKTASWIYRHIMTNELYCYTSCFRLFRKSLVEKNELKNRGFVGTVEFLWHVDQMENWRIVEVPATLTVRQNGQSKCKVAAVTWKHFKFIIKLLIDRARRISPANNVPRFQPSSKGNRI